MLSVQILIFGESRRRMRISIFSIILLLNFFLIGTVNESRPSGSDRTLNDMCSRLLNAKLGQLRIGLDSGVFTSVNLVDDYPAQIEEVSPKLRAITEINPEW